MVRTESAIAIGWNEDGPTGLTAPAGLAIPHALRRELNPVLKGQNRTVDQLLMPIVADCEVGRCQPWVIVFLRKELPLSGYVAKLRGLKSRVSMISYSIGPRCTITNEESSVPPVGALLISRKGVLEELARRSRLFRPAWETLRDCSTDERWFCVTDVPPANWVAKLATGDARRFLDARAAETRMLEPPGYEPLSTITEYREAVLATMVAEDAFEGMLWAERLVERFPHRPRAHVMLGRAHQVSSDDESAMDAYREAIRQAGSHAKAFVRELWRKDLALAERDCVERDVCRYQANLVDMETRHAVAEAWWRLGRLHYEREDYDAASAACELGLSEDSSSADLLELRAALAAMRGDLESLMEALLTTTKLPRRDGLPWYVLGDVCKATGRIHEAIHCFEESARLSPEMPLPLEKLAFLNTVRGQYEAALKYARKAIECDAEGFLVWNTMACCHVMLGQGEAAIDPAREAVKREANKHTLDTLGKAYAAAGRPDAAIKCFLKAIAKDWNHGEAWCGLGMAYLQNGKREKAQEVLDQLKRIDLAWTADLAARVEGGRG